MSADGDEPPPAGCGTMGTVKLTQESITIIRGRLYFAPAMGAVPPRDSAKVHYFCTDDEFVYEPFFADFGPLNLSCVCKYARMLGNKLRAAATRNQIVVHYVSGPAEKRANAVLLMGAAQQLLFGLSAQDAFRPFRNLSPRLLPFRDASCGPCSFELSVLDCLEGLETAINLGWFNYKTFDVEAYDFYERIENGDMNWVIPKQFIAFSCPAAGLPNCSLLKGQREVSGCCTPEYYVQVFKSFGVKLVVCLNNRQYDAKKFTKRSIDHADLFFVDGTCPSRDIIYSFLRLVENRAHPIAVHCKAGLGRTGTLIGCYAIKNYRFRASAWIGWNRLCRPGSVLGPQQKFLSDIQNDLMQMSIAENIGRTRPVYPILDSSANQLKDDISECFARLSIEDRTIAEGGDANQGEKLFMMKRQQQAAAVLSESATSTALARISSERRTLNSKRIFTLPAFVPHAVVSATPHFRNVQIRKPGIVSVLTASSKRATGSPRGDAATAGNAAGHNQVSTM